MDEGLKYHCILKIQPKIRFPAAAIMEPALLGFMKIPVSLNWFYLVQTTECLKHLVTRWLKAKPFKIHFVSGPVPFQFRLVTAHPRQRKPG